MILLNPMPMREHEMQLQHESSNSRPMCLFRIVFTFYYILADKYLFKGHLQKGFSSLFFHISMFEETTKFKTTRRRHITWRCEIKTVSSGCSLLVVVECPRWRRKKKVRGKHLLQLIFYYLFMHLITKWNVCRTEVYSGEHKKLSLFEGDTFYLSELISL